MPILTAAALYAGFAFALGFLLGVCRVLLLEPALGPLAATILELPVILALTWLAARRLVLSRGRTWTFAHAALVGLLAFVLLQAAELALTPWTFPPDQPWAQSLRERTLSPAGILGLAAQLLFAVFPALALRRSRKPM